MKGRILLLEAVDSLAFGLAPQRGSFQARLRGKIEDEGQVGPHPVQRDALQRVDQRRLHIARCALIRAGRIRKAVAQNVSPGPQGRPDRMVQVVDASRREQDRLGERAELFGSAVKNEVADFFGIGRTAGFTGCDHRHPQRLDAGPRASKSGSISRPPPRLRT